jgi:hypothetical protein
VKIDRDVVAVGMSQTGLSRHFDPASLISGPLAIADILGVVRNISNVSKIDLAGMAAFGGGSFGKTLRSAWCPTATSKFGDSVQLIGRHGPSGVRRPVPLAEPDAVVRHLRALRLRRMTLACRGLLARNMGTSVQMLETFYGHTTNRAMTTELTKNKGRQKKSLLWE